MVNELVMKERLEGIVRILDAGNDKLAKQIILGIIDEIDREIDEFEKQADLFNNCPMN